MAKDKQQGSEKAAQLTASGFALLLIGILFSSILDGNAIMRIAGVLLILAAAILFGASMRVSKEVIQTQSKQIENKDEKDPKK